jgi:beta-lactamase regulating signal transducer with metallopeptidase domain
MPNLIRRTFDYFKPVWSGNDGKPSIRRIMAIALCTDFIINVHNSVSVISKIINLIYQNKPVDAAVISSMSTTISQIVLILGIEAGLIAALLSLTTYQQVKLPGNASGS